MMYYLTVMNIKRLLPTFELNDNVSRSIDWHPKTNCSSLWYNYSIQYIYHLLILIIKLIDGKMNGKFFLQKIDNMSERVIVKKHYL